jgi:acetyltransferase-like isoleucine patch superfamily enzyme
MKNIRKAFFMFVELGLRVIIHPYLRARLLALFGARIGRNVRVYEIQLFNLENGFGPLVIEDDVHIGIGCRIDLSGDVRIGRGVTLSPGVTILTHTDPGSHHKSPLCEIYPPRIQPVRILEYCWIGSNVIILPGAMIHAQVVVGAGAIVKGDLEEHSLYAGIPARKIKTLHFPYENIQ